MTRRFRIFCMALRPQLGGSFCDWQGGYRRATTKEDAERKACPVCGGPVVAMDRSRPGR